jgi:hypothetical protein
MSERSTAGFGKTTGRAGRDSYPIVAPVDEDPTSEPARADSTGALSAESSSDLGAVILGAGCGFFLGAGACNLTGRAIDEGPTYTISVDMPDPAFPNAIEEGWTNLGAAATTKYKSTQWTASDTHNVLRGREWVNC